MKILLLAPLVPEAPIDGDRLRLYSIISYLARKHQITALCFEDPGRNHGSYGELEKILTRLVIVPMPRGCQWKQALLGLVGSRPLNVEAYKNIRMRELVAAELDSGIYDAVFCYRLRMAPYGLLAKIPRFLDYTDALAGYMRQRALEAGGVKKYVYNMEAKRLACFEADMAGQFDACFMNSVSDAEQIKRNAFQNNIQVLANGVDRFRFPRLKNWKPGNRRAVFVGHWAYPPNAQAAIWLLNDILPEIRRQMPDFELRLVGGGASPVLKKLAAAAGAVLTGFVPDLKAEMQAAGAALCPVRMAAGRQNKMLEAFAMGVPVAATRLSAAGALAEDKKHLLCGDTAAELAAALVKLIQDRSLALRLRKEAFKLTEKEYDWNKNLQQMEKTMLQYTGV